MTDFSNVKYGVSLALIAILFGGLLGLSFGCCEDDLKGFLKNEAQSALADKYDGKQDAATKVISKSWVYLKRAHFHSQAMGVISIVFSMVAVGLRFAPKVQFGISILSGLGSLGYGFFWLGSGLLAPSMGSTHAAKETMGLVAQVSGGAFFVAGVAMFAFFLMRLYVNKRIVTRE